MVAVVLGTALTTGDDQTAVAASSAETTSVNSDYGCSPQVIQDLTRYCHACWRNARLPLDQWDDCTQQVFTRLLERVPSSRWAELLPSFLEENPDRRELIRAIDSAKKRCLRGRKWQELHDQTHDQQVYDRTHSASANIEDLRQDLDHAAQRLLSPRQQQIVRLTADGWAVPEIANELNTTPERVSDEKYKAIQKLRGHFQSVE
jgi:RNA polymerase sigma factor (sigma-70 family)